MSEIDDLRAEVARLRVACTEFEDAYVGEHEDRVAAEAEVERLREDAEQLRDAYGMAFDRAADAEAKVRAVEARAWDEGYRFGRLMQFDADWQDKPKWPTHNSRQSLVSNLDRAAGSNHDNPYRTALADVPAEVTPPAEPCPYETRYALHSNGMKCCDEDGA
jgi:hypothetical protein